MAGRNGKRIATFSALSLLIFVASYVFAASSNPPKDGVYSTSNGTLLGGRASEAWCSGAGETARYIDSHGTGWIDYATNYTGGRFWLSGDNVWGNGSTDYTGALTDYNVGARVNYVAGQPAGPDLFRRMPKRTPPRAPSLTAPGVLA